MIWNKIRFGNLYAVNSKNGLTKPSKIRGNGFKMINMGELFANDRIYDIPMELVPLKESEKNTAKVEKSDLLFARQSLVFEGAGKCSIVMEVSPLTVFESHIIRVRLINSANPMFYYYYFKSSLSPMKNIVHQCAQAGIRGSDLQELDVLFPPKEVQDKIASILSSFDDLIENNQKQIRLLEEIAQRLYKEWFVDLHFPDYENTPVIDGIPEEWKRERADNFFEITIGKTPLTTKKEFFVNDMNGIPWLSISDMGKSGVFVFSTSECLTEEAIKEYNVKIVPASTVFVSFKLTVGRVAIATKNMCTNEAIAHFHINDDVVQAYTYFYLKNFQYDTLGNTSSISKAVNSTIIKSMPFIMPKRETLILFYQKVSPIFKMIRSKQLQIIRLSEARDRLLPKLMNGEIDISKIQI